MTEDLNSKLKFEDKGSERIVLATILQNSDLMVEAELKLDESDFLSDYHRTIYSLLRSLDRQGVKSFDLMSVINEASSNNMLSNIGGADYINALVSTIVDKSNFDVYAHKVLEASTKYKLFLEAENIKREILSNASSSSDNLNSSSLIVKAESRILDVSIKSQKVEDALDIKDGLEDRIAELIANPVKIVGMPTGFNILDDVINGLIPGSLTVVAARPKNGKSTLLMNIASHLSYNMNYPILYVDTEMRREEIQTRLISHISGVPERSIITGQFYRNEQHHSEWPSLVSDAIEKIRNGRYLHKYFPGFTPDGIKTLVKKYVVKEGIKAFFFDYIKLSDSAELHNAKEHQQLGFLATALKDLAGSLNIPVVTAVQLRRSETSGRERSHFTESDVGDSDRILRYCNTLMAIARKTKKEAELYKEKDPYINDLDILKKYGSHRLQILASRGGRSLFEGIDLYCHFPTLSMRQAIKQTSSFDDSEIVEEII